MLRKRDNIIEYDYGGCDMITTEDIKRLYGSKEKQEQIIYNAVEACKNSESNWAKGFWFGVFETLCDKYNRKDLFNKHVH